MYFPYVDSIETILPEFSGPSDDTYNIQQIYEAQRVLEDMDGPLVSDFSISGTLAGKKAAIYIERDAHVKIINLLPGARIEGDIVSAWSSAGFALSEDVNHPESAEKFTDIFIGSAGIRTGQMSISGNIQGSTDANNSLNITQKGGNLRFNGQAHVSTWNIETEATLSGNSSITLYGDDNILHNAGTIAPGNSIGTITIEGDFENTGTLAMEFNGKGATDRLSVTGNFQHDSAQGKVSLSPVLDYYHGSINIDTSTLFSGGAGSILPTTITDFSPAASPTLDMSISSNTSGIVSINTKRVANAYSRYAASGNVARVGRALQDMAGIAQGDMQDMLAQLDFSPLDGSGIRAALPQLTATPYAQAAQASAEANLNIGRMALAQLRAAAAWPAAEPHAQTQAHTKTQGNDKDSAPQWSAFVTPFGGGSLQQAHAGAPGYNSSQAGLMGGIYRQKEGLHLSLYSAFSRRQTDLWTAAGAQARSTALHIGSTVLWSEDSTGSGWQVWGQAQLGLENTDMQRSVAFGDYTRQNSSFYTSFNGMAQLGGSYLWRTNAFSFGPKLGLEYTFNTLPAITEESGGASRLGTDAFTRHDLRGVAGLSTAWNTDRGEDRFVRVHLDAEWRQDMLFGQQNVRTHFMGYDQYSFDSRVERKGQGSLGLSAGVEVSLHQDVTLSALAEADVLRPGYSSVGGGLSLRWEF